MKMFGRILAILSAALIVVGITFAVSHSGYLTNSTGHTPPSGFAQGQAGPPQGTNARGGPEHGDRGSAGLFGLFEVGKNLGIIAVIVAIVASLNSLVRRRKRHNSLDHQSKPPDAQVST